MSRDVPGADVEGAQQHRYGRDTRFVRAARDYRPAITRLEPSLNFGDRDGLRVQDMVHSVGTCRSRYAAPVSFYTQDRLPSLHFAAVTPGSDFQPDGFRGGKYCR